MALKIVVKYYLTQVWRRETNRSSREPLKTQRTRVTSVTCCFSVCWPKVQYIIKYVKYVTKTCENLFVQIQWFNCPVTLLYSICRTLYVIVWRRFFYYLLIIFINLLVTWPKYPHLSVLSKTDDHDNVQCYRGKYMYRD